ncbi:MAG TPA: phage Gp37/Gp68 family protein [Candidatus Hydrogenedentes bacterium]|nr:phage Gp37/Gp68 family protein [Candidatus Hydrogenedentota bacterium]HOH34508.1 phage Gp37/Gp68 family protein [Candidatus Hydrogenedentota bacterium]HPV37750.1 phage Gp37/Gp68 family protein [Candidatus Hydrogenedentota bacterium]HQE74865.1 phage Gp37/Gp68 family protein [Candidatus Hydrogenedentota bacterium]HQH70091.1 phage Gp37/Gp68 family protein [Candidatus Hydrogenedentota bacterium]
MSRSSIEWTEATWNPVTGCSKASAGCANCYAERMAMRLKAMGQPNYLNGFSVTMHERTLELPLTWRKPRTVFVNSMGDLFHDEVDADFIRRVFDVMDRASWHRFQVLTKRAERLVTLAGTLPWPEHVWMGVTVENAACAYRIGLLRQVPAAIRFISMEPLLGPVPGLDLRGIDWVIVGGESGPGARPMREEWVLDIQRTCQTNGSAFFFKQWGGMNKKKTGRLLQNRSWDEMPVARRPAAV